MPAPLQTVRLADYRPSAFSAPDIHLSFELHPRETRVTARTRFEPRSTPAHALRLDCTAARLLSLRLDGATLPPDAWRREEDALIVLDPPNRPFELEVVSMLDPAANTRLEGLYMSGGRFCTQCEAEGFRAITPALDRPDCLSRYTVRIEADQAAYPTLLSNGDPIEAGPLPNGRHFAVWRDPHPKPAYLFALVAGAFDHLADTFTTASGRRVQLGMYVDPGEASRAAYALDALKRAMRWDEEAFGREYDLDVFNIVAVRDFNFGAMENKGLNIFNAAYVLADPETASDSDFEAIESVVAHEYFHNWTGNRITLRDWFQLCLKEGLTVYRDQEFSAAQRSAAVMRIKDVQRLRARQFVEDAGPLAHPVRPESYVKIDNFYTATIYEKGAELVRMLAALLGPEAFRAGMDRYFDRCDGSAATVEDFLAAFEDAAGVSLSAFAVWYRQVGTPQVCAEVVHAPAEGETRVRLRRIGGEGGPTPPIPIRCGFLSQAGAPLALRAAGAPAAAAEHLLVLEGAEQDFRFTGAAERPLLSAPRGFSAPIRFESGLSLEDWRMLLRADPDPFVRWEASRVLAHAALVHPDPAARSAHASDIAHACRAQLAAAEDAALTALLLRPPDAAELLRTDPGGDPEVQHQARAALLASLAGALEPELLRLLHAPEPRTPDPAEAGVRALRVAAMELLAALPGREGLLLDLFSSAHTMTCQLGALEALGAQETGEGFDAALSRFAARWGERPLVMDKWFAVQAAAPRADAWERLERLRAHPDFDLAAPNRVRALTGPLSLRNPRVFHAPDGRGYVFLAAIAKAVDARNPALGARLLAGFETWRSLEPGRSARARRVLLGLQSAPDLSKNARDILERTLAEG
jgi:aminopeptidase N